MKLRGISIQAFRSLYGVDLEPTDLTVLIGPNNAGKTTLGEALDFLSDVHRFGIEDAVIRKGGFDNIAHRRMRRTKHAISFDTHVELDESELRPHALGRTAVRQEPLSVPDLRALRPRVQVSHHFEINAVSERLAADFAVRAERVTLLGATRDTNWERLITLERTSSGIMISPLTGRGVTSAWHWLLGPLLDTTFIEYIRDNVVPTALVLNQVAFFSSTLRYVQRTLGTARLYQLVPTECRQPGVPTPSPELSRHGQNLPALVRYMQARDARAWQEVLENMQKIVPGLVAVHADVGRDRRLTLEFQEEGVGRPWTSEEISDGTIQSLAMFCALFDSRSPLTFIEEPENSVHPWIIRVFVDACRSVRDKQVILTTHSPALINYLRPEEIDVVWRRKGRTKVAPLVDLDPQAPRLWESGESSIFDLVDSGWIRETIPDAFT